MSRLKVGEGKISQGTATILAGLYQPACNMMRLSERNPFSSQKVGQFCGQGEITRQVRPTVHGQRLKASCGHTDTGNGGVHGIKERSPVLLEIAVVSHGQAFRHRNQRIQRPDYTSGFTPHQLRRIWVALLRHDARPCAPGLSQTNPIKLPT